MTNNLETRIEREGNVHHIYRSGETYLIVYGQHDIPLDSAQFPACLNGVFLEFEYPSFSAISKLINNAEIVTGPLVGYSLLLTGERKIPLFFPDVYDSISCERESVLEKNLERDQRLVAMEDKINKLKKGTDKLCGKDLCDATIIAGNLFNSLVKKFDHEYYLIRHHGRNLLWSYKLIWLNKHVPGCYSITAGTGHIGLTKTMLLSSKDLLEKLSKLKHLFHRYANNPSFYSLPRLDFHKKWCTTYTYEIPELKELIAR